MYVNPTFSSAHTENLANIQSRGLHDWSIMTLSTSLAFADEYRQWKSNNSTIIRLVKGQRPKQSELIPVSLAWSMPKV